MRGGGTMRAYGLGDGGYVLRELPVPTPGPGQLLVRVKAATFNKRDTLILRGVYPLPAKPGVVPLSDGAGEVAALGPGVSGFAVGDRVVGSYWTRWRDGRLDPTAFDQLGCTSDGMLAEYAVLEADTTVHVPEHLTWAEAATLPCAGVTAWTSLTGGGALAPGSTVVTLGTGGVSLYVVQLAKALGLRVIATTSSAAKAARVRELGADEVVDYVANPGWGAVVRELTGGAGADLVVDTTGPDGVDESILAAGLYGDVVLLTTQSATRADVTVSGAAWARTMAGIRRVFVGSAADLRAMVRVVGEGGIRPVVGRVFGFEPGEVEEAYRWYVGAAGFGKVVVGVG